MGCVFDVLGKLYDGFGFIFMGCVNFFFGKLLYFLWCQCIKFFFVIGVCVIDVFIFFGQGQCFGFFVGLGVGKFMFMGMIVCGVDVDVVVIVLVGECGCEVCEFIEKDFGFEGFVCFVVVVVIFDIFVLFCFCVVYIVIFIVEVYCDQGKNVFFFMDLVMCFVMVQCEIGFVVGELFVICGYMFLVFVMFLCFFECFGVGESGVIIVFYIVFVEGDDMNEFVVDVVCGIFDGYIVFFCVFVYVNYYFVIDVLESISCFMCDVCMFEEVVVVGCVWEYFVVYWKNEDLIIIGVY